MKLKKAVDSLDSGVITDILGADKGYGLYKIVSDSEANIVKATKERDDNAEYKKARQACKDFSQGLNDVKKYQKAKACLALALMERQEDLTDEELAAIDDAKNRAQAYGLKKHQE